MPEARIIRLHQGRPVIETDRWRLLAAGEASDGADGVLLPLPRLLEAAGADRLPGAATIGAWLAPDDDPRQLAPWLGRLALVAVQFPKFTDGRGYSIATLLRTRLGWRGELRAIGDVLQDQLFALRRVGFDSFALRADRDPQAALVAFGSFTLSYQGAVDDPRPHFRRPQAA